MKIGNFEIRAINTGNFGLDGGSMFGIVPKALWEKHYSRPDEANRIPLAARILFIDTGSRKILIDTGNGNKFSEKQANIYNIDLTKSHLQNSLTANGINPNEITDVILTHLHFDHCGGSTHYVGGEVLPTLPNATFYVQREQFEWAMNPTEKDRASFMNHDFEPLKNLGKLNLLEQTGEIFPGIELITLFGHTPAMQAVIINANGKTFFYPADLFPTRAHLNLPYILSFDNYPLTTLEEKKKLLPQIIEEEWIVVFEHDAFVDAATITKQNGIFTMKETISL